MKTKALSLIVLSLILVLNACAPLTTSNPGDEPPAPVSEAEGYQPVTVDHAEVEVGVGSPIPVHVNVSGSLPDTCAQIEYSEIKQDGTNFIVTLSTVASTNEGCVQDALPFRISLPLNVVN